VVCDHWSFVTAYDQRDSDVSVRCGGFCAFCLLAYNVGMAEAKSVVEHVQQALSCGKNECSCSFQQVRISLLCSVLAVEATPVGFCFLLI
jgi:hypothetical protein